jgi:hypothetical protein
MLSWLVIIRSTLRRLSLLPSPKSLPLNSFADPHPLTPVPSIFYKKGGGEGVPSAPPIPVSFPRSLSLHPSKFNRIIPFADTHPLNSIVSYGCKNRGSQAGFQNSPLATVLIPPVPLQPGAFGATIPKGTRFLYDPRKQLRSPRCLRIVSGHRELSTDVPDRKSLVLTSALARRPRSSVLAQRALLDRLAGWLAFHASGKDAG